MNASWQRFLATQPDPGNSGPLLLEQPLICSLQNHAVIRVQGSDAADFLQSQLSCNLDMLNARHSQLGALHTPKGRVLAILRLLQNNDKIFLLLPANLAEPVINHLGKFILRSEVSLDHRDHDVTVLGLAGPGVDKVLDLANLPCPVDTNQASAGAELVTVRLHGKVPRFICMGPAEAVQNAWLRLAHQVNRGRENDWTLRRMLAGVPEIHPQTADKFIPQMLSLDVLGAISFSKGCYPGQEIIARARYLGQVKRHLVLGHADTHAEPGETLYTGTETTVAGTVVESCKHPQGDWLVQAVVQADAVQNRIACRLASGGTLTLDKDAGG